MISDSLAQPSDLLRKRGGEDLKTYRNQAVIDVIGKRKKFRRISLESKTLIDIQDYLKVSGNGTGLDHAIFNTLGKHGPYEERGLAHKSVDCLIKSVIKRPCFIQKGGVLR